MEGLRYGREIRWLFQTAMLVFLVTIGLGMSRGLGLIDFANRNQMLTHLHSGTIGWVTLGVMATVLWLYGDRGPRTESDRFVTWTSAILMVTVPVYLLAFWSGNLPFRAISGGLLLLGIAMYAGWLVTQAAHIGYRRLTTPQLGAVVGLVTLVLGSTLGVFLQVQFATETSVLPGEPVGAHAETQISGYLVLVAMSIAYWRLHGNDRTRRGTWMVWLFFVGGLIVAISLLANQVQGAGAYIPLVIAAFVILLTLVWRKVLAPGWFEAASGRHYAAAIPFTIVYLAIFIYLILGFAVLQIWADFSEVPPGLLPASVHPLMLGVVTNTLFGVLIDLDHDQRHLWPWADHVVFWGMNVAVGLFTVALLFQAEWAFAIITPVLGISLLTGIVTHTMRINARPSVAAAPASS
jgi:uncharacterized protein (DUF486 family)